ncbi:MAG: uroporphyrinogen decarboxylase family protein [Armatimonadota bacterium]
MNSKERILRTMARQSCDRIPISTYHMVPFYAEFFANNEPSYARLMSVIKENIDNLYPCSFLPVNEDESSIRSEVKAWDEGSSHFNRTVRHTSKGDLSTLIRWDDRVATYWMLEYPLKCIDDIEKYMLLPNQVSDVDISGIVTAFNRLDGQFGVPLIGISDPAGAAASNFDYSEFLVLCITEKVRMKKFIDFIFEREIEILRLGLERLKYLNEVCLFQIMGPELISPPCLPESYLKEFMLPYIKLMIELIHKYGHYVEIHCHGRTSDALKYFIEAGADGTDPVEPPPQGDITLNEAKRIYGNDIVLLGNIEMSLLEMGETEDVVEYVKDMVTVGKKGGGYIALPSSFPFKYDLDERTERNYLAFIETALEYGRY